MQGFSLKQISQDLGVSKGSVSTWVRDVELTNDQKLALKNRQRNLNGSFKGAKTNRIRAIERRKLYQAHGREEAKQGSQLHLIGCMLYWAEGAKSRNCLNFVNSDTHMMQLYVQFLRNALKIDEQDIVIHIISHYYNPIDIARVESYWLEILSLPATCLRKTVYKEGGKSRRNILEYGVCSVRVYKTEVVQRVYGAIQEYGGFNNPDWLF